MLLYSVSFSLIIGIILVNADRYDLFKKRRMQILKAEAESCIGNDIVLTDNEEIVNNIIMNYKYEMMDFSYDNPKYFNFSQHYFHYKKFLPKSKLYKIIKRMPKGGALHVHDTAMLGPDYLLMNVTYMDNLYVCLSDIKSNLPKFIFRNRTPKLDCDTKWELLSDVRNRTADVKKFDSDIRKLLTLVIDNPEEVDTDINVVWERFAKIFLIITPMLTYKPVWEKYFYDALLKFRSDNIMYMEVRTTMPELYDLDGQLYHPHEAARVYKSVADRFIKDYPDFIGVSMIYAPLRNVALTAIDDYLKTARDLKSELGDFIAGFDLVGQEDLGKPLIDFAPSLVEAENDVIDYFFHCGETNWFGTLSDNNCIDAVLLGSKRLGHAYAILKHPEVLELVRSNKIALEVNVISNQVLKLVNDLRNHPLSILLTQNVPIVVSSDDPGLWEAEPLSDDYFVVFLGVLSRNSQLSTLKKLVWNSIEFSSLTAEKKFRALSLLEKKWTRFIDQIVQETIYIEQV